ncbi:MAG: O-antigen biosynthesis protein WbqP [Clostridiales bacterium]|nr:O-antigen biosynthesis protein WbqP [Clostridiales bacterium]
MYQRAGKRLLDILLSLLLILLLSWLLILVAVVVKLTSRGTVLFCQKRVGIHKSYFNIYKFRTMRTDTPNDLPTHLLANPDTFITPIGRFLRKTSLDELPQLFNILRGDMSFVGPRPALWNQEDLILERDRYGANDIRPGLTGWAQINGRDEIEIPLKAKLDGEYTIRESFAFDVMIFGMTFFRVLKKDGVKEGGTGAGQE